MADVDAALDAVGVRLEAPAVMCGNCMAEMIRVSPRSLKCPKCNLVYKE